MRLVAAVAQMFGGQVPGGAQAGSPMGTPGIAPQGAGMQMPPGLSGQPPQPGMPQGQPQGPMGMPGMPQGGQPGTPPPMSGMPGPGGAPPPPGTPPGSGGHLGAMTGMQPQPGMAPQNQNPGQPLAQYKIGDQPWMRQDMPGAGQNPNSPQNWPAPVQASTPQPAAQPQAPQQAPQQGQGQGQPTLPTPPVYTPWTQDKIIAEIRRANPGIGPKDIAAKLPYATKELESQNKQNYDMQTKSYENQRQYAKDQLTQVKEDRLHKALDARSKHNDEMVSVAKERLRNSQGESERKAAEKAYDQALRLRGQDLGARVNLLNQAPTAESKALYDEVQDSSQDAEDKGTAAPQGGSDKPPMEGAKKAPDGKWYVQKDGKYHPVLTGEDDE